MAPSCRDGLLYLMMTDQKGSGMGRTVRFDPYNHHPVTDQDRKRIENALWEGWELMVDKSNGDVWIGDREERIAEIVIAQEDDK